MVIVSISNKKAGKDILGDCLDTNILMIVSSFIRKDVFDKALTDVGPIIYWGEFLPNEDNWICNWYDGCNILFHEFLFSLIGYHIPFNESEVNILKHFLISPS